MATVYGTDANGCYAILRALVILSMAGYPQTCPLTVQSALKRRSWLPVKIRLQVRPFFHAQKRK